MLGDMDRLTADLCVAPMQVSLRDIIAFGLLIGMTITTASKTYLEMTGPSGCIKSSHHLLMGGLIRFSAFATDPRSFHKGLRKGDIGRSWPHRLQGLATVAKWPYIETKRDYYEKFGLRWRHNRRKLLKHADHTSDAPEQKEDEAVQITFIDTAGKQHLIPVDQCETWEVRGVTVGSSSLFDHSHHRTGY